MSEVKLFEHQIRVLKKTELRSKVAFYLDM